jgi:hypothetical protein
MRRCVAANLGKRSVRRNFLVRNRWSCKPGHGWRHRHFGRFFDGERGAHCQGRTNFLWLGHENLVHRRRSRFGHLDRGSLGGCGDLRELCNRRRLRGENFDWRRGNLDFNN